MANKKLMTSVAFTAALLAGGVAGAVLGVPGVSGAQTTTVPNAPSTTVPGGGQPNPDRPPHDGTCPNMGGTGTGTGTGTGSGGSGFPGGNAPSQGTGASQTRFHYGGRF